MLRLEHPKAIMGLKRVCYQFGRRVLLKDWLIPENGFATNCKTIIYASGKFVAAGLRNVDDFDPYSSIAISNDGDNWSFAP